MKRCRLCASQIDIAAKRCPNCRAKQGNWMARHPILAGISIIITLMISLSSFQSFMVTKKEAACRANLTTEQRLAEDAEKVREGRFSAARGACLITLKKTLNDPDNAQLEPTRTWHVMVYDNETVVVQPVGRAKNAFGAYVNGAWNCVTKSDGGMISVLSLTQIRP